MPRIVRRVGQTRTQGPRGGHLLKTIGGRALSTAVVAANADDEDGNGDGDEEDKEGEGRKRAGSPGIEDEPMSSEDELPAPPAARPVGWREAEGEEALRPWSNEAMNLRRWGGLGLGKRGREVDDDGEEERREEEGRGGEVEEEEFPWSSSQREGKLGKGYTGNLHGDGSPAARGKKRKKAYGKHGGIATSSEAERQGGDKGKLGGKKGGFRVPMAVEDVADELDAVEGIVKGQQAGSVAVEKARKPAFRAPSRLSPLPGGETPLPRRTTRSRGPPSRAKTPPPKKDVRALARDILGAGKPTTTSLLSSPPAPHPASALSPVYITSSNPSSPLSSLFPSPTSPSSSISSFIHHQPPTTSAPSDPPIDLTADTDTPSQSPCPICKAPVPSNLLSSFTTQHLPSTPTTSTSPLQRNTPRLPVLLQTKFCLSHRRAAARATWLDRHYPTISWTALPTRISALLPHLRSILHGTASSPYLRELTARLNAGRNRTLHQALLDDALHHLTPGYYGGRGARVMLEGIMAGLGPELRRGGLEEGEVGEVVRKVGVVGLAQGVLVMEVGCRLVAEDMGLDVREDEGLEEARRVLREGVELGDLLCEDVEDGYGGWVRAGF